MPKSAKKENRVLLTTQRVKPQTLEKLKRMKKNPVHRGLGKAIDYCVEGAKE